MKTVTTIDNTFHGIFFHSLPPVMSVLLKHKKNIRFTTSSINIEVQVRHNASLNSAFKIGRLLYYVSYQHFDFARFCYPIVNNVFIGINLLNIITHCNKFTKPCSHFSGSFIKWWNAMKSIITIDNAMSYSSLLTVLINPLVLSQLIINLFWMVCFCVSRNIHDVSINWGSVLNFLQLWIDTIPFPTSLLIIIKLTDKMVSVSSSLLINVIQVDKWKGVKYWINWATTCLIDPV